MSRADASTPPSFKGPVVIALVVVGVLGFAIFLVLSAFAGDLRKATPRGEHAQSTSATGYAALVALLRSEGRTVHLHRGALGELGGDSSLLVLTPRPGEELSEVPLGDTYADTLIILPKWATLPDPQLNDWVRRIGPLPSDLVQKSLNRFPSITLTREEGARAIALSAARPEDYPMPGLRDVRVESLQTLGGAGIDPILLSDRGGVLFGRVTWADDLALPSEVAPEDPREAAAWQEALSADVDAAETDTYVEETAPAGEFAQESEFGEEEFANDEEAAYYGDIYILADPDFLNTQGLADLARAEAGVAIINVLAPSETSPVTFDLTLHGLERSRNLMKLLLEPPFLPATLCVVLAGLLMGLHALAGGGVPQRAGRDLALGSATLVDNSALLVAQARRERAMGRRYAAMMRTVASQWAGVPSGLSEKQQVEMLDAISRASHQNTTFTQLSEAASTAETPSTLLRAVRRLHTWKQELGRDRRGS